jgi:selenocysteine lyase/cysteine desulfurase
MSATSLENYFKKYRGNIIGCGHTLELPWGKKEVVYADWTASARGYQHIEQRLQNEVIPFFANTHTQTTSTGSRMTRCYEEAKTVIKGHVNASNSDVLIFCGSGMTSAVNKLQRLLGIRLPEGYVRYTTGGKPLDIDEALRPVVFVTSMEHHSNHVSWLETIAKVEVIGQTEDGHVDLQHLESLLLRYRLRKNKIAAITACSNVTGIQSPYGEIARIMHTHGGLCFVDFAASAPYVEIDMHPADPSASLDAIYFSMHKFLGGPGTPGILIYNEMLCDNRIPDHPGGGTLLYSNPWGGREYVHDTESREDGGTPPVLQAVKAAMCIQLKEEMGIEKIRQREDELIDVAFARFQKITNIRVLQDNIKKRLGIISFIIDGLHYNLAVKTLNDRFGIQMRGGCSCAGTYGHALLKVQRSQSFDIWQAINSGDMSSKPGWIRLSLHPTMTNKEVEFIMDAIESTALNFRVWMVDYEYDAATNEFYSCDFNKVVR